MSDQESPIQSTAQAVSQLAKEVPIYPDLVQPSAKALGEGIGGLLEAMMQPLIRLRIKAKANTQKFAEEYQARLEAKPADVLKQPDPVVAGPLLEALKYTVQEDDLRAMFVNLLSAASDTRTSSLAHPAFVEIIRQLSPEDASVITRLAFAEWFPVLQIAYASDNEDILPYRIIEESKIDNLRSHQRVLENLIRLQLVRFGPLSHDQLEVSGFNALYEKAKLRYKHLEDEHGISRAYHPNEDWASYNPLYLTTTAFGADFLKTCVTNKEG